VLAYYFHWKSGQDHMSDEARDHRFGGLTIDAVIGIIVFLTALVVLTPAIMLAFYELVFGDDRAQYLWVAIIPAVLASAAATFCYSRLLDRGRLIAAFATIAASCIGSLLIWLCSLLD
jgi:hypothetical protein